MILQLLILKFILKNEKLGEKLRQEKNINIKDIVEFSKHIKETFKNNDVEVLFEKENGEYAKYNYGDYVENIYDELLDNISEEAKVYRQVIKEEIDNITDKDGIIEEKDLKTLFNKYGTYSKDLFENDKKVFRNKTDIEKEITKSNNFISKEQKQLQNKIKKVEEKIAKLEENIAELEETFSKTNPTEEQLHQYNQFKEELKNTTAEWEDLILQMEE